MLRSIVVTNCILHAGSVLTLFLDSLACVFFQFVDTNVIYAALLVLKLVRVGLLGVCLTGVVLELARASKGASSACVELAW